MSPWQWIADLDWSAFVPSTLAGVIGAGIGVFGVHWGFRLQRRKEYVEGVDDAIATVMQEIADFAGDIVRYETEVEDRNRAPQLVVLNPTSVRPANHFSLSVALDITEMRANGQDRDVVQHALRVFRRILEITSLTGQKSELGSFSAALGRWRADRMNVVEAHLTLNKVEAIAISWNEH